MGNSGGGGSISRGNRGGSSNRSSNVSCSNGTCVINPSSIKSSSSSSRSHSRRGVNINSHGSRSGRSGGSTGTPVIRNTGHSSVKTNMTCVGNSVIANTGSASVKVKASSCHGGNIVVNTGNAKVKTPNLSSGRSTSNIKSTKLHVSSSHTQCSDTTCVKKSSEVNCTDNTCTIKNSVESIPTTTVSTVVDVGKKVGSQKIINPNNSNRLPDNVLMEKTTCVKLKENVKVADVVCTDGLCEVVPSAFKTVGDNKAKQPSISERMCSSILDKVKETNAEPIHKVKAIISKSNEIPTPEIINDNRKIAMDAIKSATKTTAIETSKIVADPIASVVEMGYEINDFTNNAANTIITFFLRYVRKIYSSSLQTSPTDIEVDNAVDKLNESARKLAETMASDVIDQAVKKRLSSMVKITVEVFDSLSKMQQVQIQTYALEHQITIEEAIKEMSEIGYFGVDNYLGP